MSTPSQAGTASTPLRADNGKREDGAGKYAEWTAQWWQWVYSLPVEAFPRVRKVLFQDLNMPDNSWNRKGLNIPLRRAFEIFVPNVCAIDMDTTGTWPFGRRLEDQVATRFLSMFLDMTAELGGRKYKLEAYIGGDDALESPDGDPNSASATPNATNEKSLPEDFP